MTYTGNYRVDAVLLVAINDGDGSQCGTDYRGRVDHARKENPRHEYEGRGFWNMLFRRAARHTNADILVNLTSEEARAGAKFLRQYYQNLIAEGA